MNNKSTPVTVQKQPTESVARASARDLERIETLGTYVYLLAYTAPLSVTSLLAFGRGETVLGSALAAFALTALFVFWYVLRRGLGVRARALLVSAACALFFYLIASGGYSATGLFWCFSIFVAINHFSSARVGVAVNLALLLVSGIFLQFPVFRELHPDYGTAISSRFLVSGTITCLLIFFYAMQQEVLRGRLRDTQAQLLYASMTDELTGLTNRRSMKDRLRQADRRRNGPRVLAIAIADLDHFKRVNDSLGHDAGDHVLRHVSDVLRDAMRASDHVARWGGEEFLILIEARSDEEAIDVVERARASIEASPTHYGGADIAVTASFGLAVVPPGADSVNDSIIAADNNLLLAKEQGRNRVVSG